jgi:RNA polymerase sigma-70 factor, ECF subfamily
MSDTVAYDVFVSYARPDGPVVEQVIAAMRAVNVTVFDAREHSSMFWGHSLSRFIENAFPGRIRAAIPFLSRHYVASPSCTDELSAFAKRLVEEPNTAKLFPIRLDDVSVPVTLKHISYVDLAATTPTDLARRIRSTLYGSDVLTDAQLLSLVAKNGDPAAYTLLIERLLPAIWTTARRVSRDTSDIDDIVQDVVIRLWRNLDQYKPSAGSLLAWVTAITRNTALDYFRRKLRGKRKQSRITDVPAKESPSSEEQQETVGRMEQAINELPDIERTVLLAVLDDTYEEKELAKKLSIKPLDVRRAYHDAIAKLRIVLASTAAPPKSLGSR